MSWIPLEPVVSQTKLIYIKHIIADIRQVSGVDDISIFSQYESQQYESVTIATMANTGSPESVCFEGTWSWIQSNTNPRVPRHTAHREHHSPKCQGP